MRSIAALLCMWLVLSCCSWAHAGAPTDQLKAAVDQMILILEDPALKPDSKTEERRAAIRREADRIFDFEETSKRALGPHWQKLGTKDRQEFVTVFTELLERSYISKIERYSGEKTLYTSVAVDGDLATVKTRFITKSGKDIPVDYRMHRRGDRWLVYDVVAEGISLVGNYWTQFNKILQTASYEDLVARLKGKQIDVGTPASRSRRSRGPEADEDSR
jgi:phospholipid transport system substrate-binding protein